TALNSSSQTTRIRSSKPVRLKQMDGLWKETTRSTASQHRRQRRKRSGSKAS
ncbi:hypothetical protein M9458_024669, partial [Cirrhinus mrigala]